MVGSVKTLTPLLLFCLFGAAAGEAQTYEFGVLGGYARMNAKDLGSVSAESPKESDTSIQADHAEGIWLTANTRGYYGHELTYLQTRFNVDSVLRTVVNNSTVTTTARDRTAVRQLSYNFLIYFMPRGERWRPFVTGGLQANQYHQPNIEGWPSGYVRHYGANWGGGIKFHLLPHTVLRLDARDYYGGKPYKLNLQTGGSIHELTATAGFGFTF